MVKIITALIFSVALLGSALIISDGISRTAPTNGVVLDNGQVLLFYRGGLRSCMYYEFAEEWGCRESSD